MMRVRPLLAAGLLCVLASGCHAAPLRILCVGDSITQGGRADRDESTYRLPLQALLRSERIDFDFVGTRRAGLHRLAAWPSWFDADHEGYYGAKTAAVRDLLHAHIAALPAPDVVLVHLGTNDHHEHEGFTEPLEHIIRLVRAKNPRVTILVGHLALNGWRAKFERWRVNRMVERLDSTQSRVVAVNHYEGWNADPSNLGADTYDWVHPNAKGQQVMAMHWLTAMRPFLRQTQPDIIPASAH
jgi:acyl-CoA thioesterase I